VVALRRAKTTQHRKEPASTICPQILYSHLIKCTYRLHGG
jgi:hypothetical protein